MGLVSTILICAWSMCSLLKSFFFVTIFAGYVQLFYHPDNTQTAFTFRPDIMEPEEKETFPEFVR